MCIVIPDSNDDEMSAVIEFAGESSDIVPGILDL